MINIHLGAQARGHTGELSLTGRAHEQAGGPPCELQLLVAAQTRGRTGELSSGRAHAQAGGRTGELPLGGRAQAGRVQVNPPPGRSAVPPINSACPTSCCRLHVCVGGQGCYCDAVSSILDDAQWHAGCEVSPLPPPPLP